MIARKIGSATWIMLAVIWSLCLGLAISLQVKNFWETGLSFDLMRAEPTVAYDDVARQAHRRISSMDNDRTILMMGLPISESDKFEESIQTLKNKWQPPKNMRSVEWESIDVNDSLVYYQQISHNLMAMADQLELQSATDDALLARALESLTTIDSNNFIHKTEDPLGLFARWVQKRLPQSTVITTGNTLKLYADNYAWAIFIYEAASHPGLNPFDFERSIERFKSIALDINPEAQVLVRGTPYDASVMAKETFKDMIAILVFLVATFTFLARQWTKSKKLCIFALMATLAGLAMGMAITILVFEQITFWMLPLAIGYLGLGSFFITYISFAHHMQPGLTPAQCLEKTFPSLIWITVALTVPFALLWFVPIEVWQQLSVLMTSATLSCMITVVLFYPLVMTKGEDTALDQHERWQKHSRFWPRFSLARWQKSPVDFIGFFVISTFTLVVGFYLLEDANPDRLYEKPVALELDRARVDNLLMIPSATRFFLVSSGSAQETLMSEEALRMGFIQRRFSNMTTTAVSKWIPSQARAHRVQSLRATLLDRIDAPLSAYLGAVINKKDTPQPPPDFEKWLASPVSAPVRHLWLGENNDRVSSIIQVAGISTPFIPQLEALADSLSGVTFIDTVTERNALLAENRFLFGGLFLVLVVSAATISLFHYGLDTWRMVVPPVAGSLASLAILSWLKFPFSVFMMIAMMIALGVGLAISLMYQNNRKHGSKSLVLLAYAFIMNLMGFGINALASAPYAKLFGVTIAVSLLVTSLLIFLLRAEDSPEQSNY